MLPALHSITRTFNQFYFFLHTAKVRCELCVITHKDESNKKASHIVYDASCQNEKAFIKFLDQVLIELPGFSIFADHLYHLFYSIQYCNDQIHLMNRDLLLHQVPQQDHRF